MQEAGARPSPAPAFRTRLLSSTYRVFQTLQGRTYPQPVMSRWVANKLPCHQLVDTRRSRPKFTNNIAAVTQIRTLSHPVPEPVCRLIESR